MVEKKKGRITGWISYTWSKTNRQIDGINKDRTYLASFDKRHNVALAGMIQLGKRMTVSTVFKYATGSKTTIPTGTFSYLGASFNYYSDRNGYQLPDYHSLDIEVNLPSRKNANRKWQGEWVFGINNVYNRHNTFALFVKQTEGDLLSSTASNFYLYGITPFVTYNFKF